MGLQDKCCVKGCRVKRRKEDLERGVIHSYFLIPKKPAERRDAWISFINRHKNGIRDSWKVCNEHFEKGKPCRKESSVDYIPSILPKIKQTDTGSSEVEEENHANDDDDDDDGDEFPSASSEDEDELFERTKGICPIPNCNKTFLDSLHMKIHYRRHGPNTEAPDPMDMICPHCHKKFFNKWGVQHHIEMVHENRRNFICDVCGADFKRKRELEEHKPSHSDTPHNVCTFCGKSFSFSSNLRQHIKRIHEKKSDFICDFCGKSYASESHFREHVRNHEHHSSFNCDQCTKVFVNRSRLRTHQLRDHGKTDVPTYSCQDCGKTFWNRAGVEAHMKTHQVKTGYTKHEVKTRHNVRDMSTSVSAYTDSFHTLRHNPYGQFVYEAGIMESITTASSWYATNNWTLPTTFQQNQFSDQNEQDSLKQATTSSILPDSDDSDHFSNSSSPLNSPQRAVDIDKIEDVSPKPGQSNESPRRSAKQSVKHSPKQSIDESSNSVETSWKDAIGKFFDASTDPQVVAHAANVYNFFNYDKD